MKHTSLCSRRAGGRPAATIDSSRSYAPLGFESEDIDVILSKLNDLPAFQ
jgi:hypothetical protein